MKKGELNKLIRERTQVIVAKLPVQLNRKQTNLIETAVKEVVQSISEDMMKLDNTELVQQEEELQEIKSLWKKLTNKLS